MSHTELEAVSGPLVGGSPAEKTVELLKEISAEAATACRSAFFSTPLGKAGGTNKMNKPGPCSLVIRLNKTDRSILDKLSCDYAESMVTVLGKSLKLYRAIVEAGEQGGKLIMLTGGKYLTRAAVLAADGTGKDIMLDSQPVETLINCPHEAAIAVRYLFPDEGKSPIQLNSQYIKPTKGIKTERIAIRAGLAFMENLSSLENKTGLSKSAVLRDSVHLYNFVKRESEKSDASFYIGNVLVTGI